MRKLQWCFCVCLIGVSTNALAMGLRSFVALPLEQGGMVFRLQDLETLNSSRNVAIANFAYGLTGKQTLLLGLPTRISPSGTHRTGDLSVLYRHTVWQQDHAEGTNRIGLLAGGLLPTNSASDGGVQAGAVETSYFGRHEIDVDALWSQGFGQSPNRALYDVSYQYRLVPAEYPETRLVSQWNGVIEYNGRWLQQNHLIHQSTIGLQWVHPSWVLEGGVIQDINSPHDTQLIISTRIHI